MTDDDLTDANILDTSIYHLRDSVGRLQLALSPLADVEAKTLAIQRVGGVINAVVDGLTIMRDRRPTDPVFDAVMTAAAEHFTGRMSAEDFTHVVTLASFQAEGVEATADQYQQRLAEFNLIESFLGGG